MIRNVLVTGAGSGIGLATAVHLAGLGYQVHAVVLDESEPKALGEAAANAGVTMSTQVADLADPAARDALEVESLDLWAVINNAGYMNAGELRDVTLDEARLQLEAMVIAPIDLARRALPAMVDRANGRIVNVTSSASHTTTPLTGWYQASKAALRALTDALRQELDGMGVDVIDIEPGGVSTGIWGRAKTELEERRGRSRQPERYDWVIENMDQFQPKMAEPEKVAEAIGDVLSTGRARTHVRVGKEALPLRLLSEIVPDKVADRFGIAIERRS